jgi:DNA-binding XRE family transcriptional regulator
LAENVEGRRTAAESEKEMTPAQCRQVRELLSLTHEQFADMADPSSSTVADFEAGRYVADCLSDALAVAPMASGVEFSTSDGAGAVIKLRKGSGS